MTTAEIIAVLARLRAMLDATICLGCGAELDFEVAAVAVPLARPYAVLWPEDATWAYACACGWDDEGDAGGGPPTVRDRLPAAFVALLEGDERR